MTTTFETLKTKQIEQRTKIQDRVGKRNPGVDKSMGFGHESAVELNAKCGLSMLKSVDKF